jgi:DNA repair exonuclease SbcCD ATPase subunit
MKTKKYKGGGFVDSITTSISDKLPIMGEKPASSSDDRAEILSELSGLQKTMESLNTQKEELESKLQKTIESLNTQKGELESKLKENKDKSKEAQEKSGVLEKKLANRPANALPVATQTAGRGRRKKRKSRRRTRF